MLNYRLSLFECWLLSMGGLGAMFVLGRLVERRILELEQGQHASNQLDYSRVVAEAVADKKVVIFPQAAAR